MAFQTSFSKGTDRDTQCASHWINIAMTFKGPVVWLVNSFWQAQDNQTPQQCVNSQNQAQMNKVFQYGRLHNRYRLTQLDPKQGTHAVHAFMLLTQIQVWACLRVKGKHSDCCSHRKNHTSLNRRAGFTHCSEVSGYTTACVYACVFIPATNNLGSFGTR